MRSRLLSAPGGRKRRGSSLAELPAALWLLFVGMIFPFIGLATLTLRSTFLNTIAKDAAHAAAKAQTFSTSSATKPSAQQIVTDCITQEAAKFAGINVTGHDLHILITNIATGTTVSQPTKLAAPPDAENNLYSAEVVVKGTVDPLIRVTIPLVSGVPGLDKPLVLECRGCETFENPQGLNK